jgi:RimJ/RimL family protein N-acetyltransferase
MEKKFNKIFGFSKQAALVVILLVAGVPLGYVAWRQLEIYKSTLDVTQLIVAPQEVTGKIVTLRKLKEEYFFDWHNMFSSTVRKMLEYPDEITLEYSITHLRHEMEKDLSRKILFYCIFDNKDKKLIGAIQIREKNPDDPGQFSWWINESYWGGGRAREAFKLISNVYFRLTNAQSFSAHVRLWNKRSYEALKKVGFKEIGFFYENRQPVRRMLEFSRPK